MRSARLVSEYEPGEALSKRSLTHDFLGDNVGAGVFVKEFEGRDQRDEIGVIRDRLGRRGRFYRFLWNPRADFRAIGFERLPG